MVGYVDVTLNTPESSVAGDAKQKMAAWSVGLESWFC